MNDDALIRLANLKALNLTPKDLSDRVGGRVSYWADLLRGEKSFGEKAARKIEEHLGIPRMSLDTADADEPIPTPQPAQPEAEQIAAAIELLTKALMNTDEFTRGLVRHSLSQLGFDSSGSVNISQKIADLLVKKSEPSVAGHDFPVSGGKIGKLIGGSATQELGGKNGRSDRDEGPKAAKR